MVSVTGIKELNLARAADKNQTNIIMQRNSSNSAAARPRSLIEVYTAYGALLKN